MNNSRRFTAQKNTAPNTPRGTNRVLPTPPASVTPVFRPVEDSANTIPRRNTESVNARPQTAPSAQPEIVPKLPLGRFSKSRKPQPENNGPGADSHTINSPARKNRVQDAPGEGERTRSHRIFGRSNGLLPAMSPSPPPPVLVTRSAQQTASPRLSSPVSPIADHTSPEDLGTNAFGDDLETHGPHTSTSTIFNQAQVTDSGLLDDGTVYRRTVQAHSVVRHGSMRGQPTVTDFQDEFEEQAIGSPSPTTSTYAKRRAGEHNGQAAPKRIRTNLNPTFDDDHYPSQELEAGPPSTAPQASQTLPRGYYSTSLESFIESHQTEWVAAQKRWETCTMEEWQDGPKELTVELDKVMDMVKKFMAKRMEVYAGINKDVQTHKTRLDARDALLVKEKERLIKQAGGLAGGFV